MFLIFDTETTGLPRNFKAPISDTDNWPRLVQLAWQLHDEQGNLLEVKNFIVKPDGFTIPYNSEKIHGISTERANREGISLERVMKEFSADLEKTKFIIGHNINFDINICGCEYFRLGQEGVLEKFKALDTVTLSTEYCAIPGGKGGKFKWPNLTELHHKLFNEGFDAAHNASADVEATTRCFLELIRLNIIPLKTLEWTNEQLENFKKNNPSQVKAIGLNIEPYHENNEEEIKTVVKPKTTDGSQKGTTVSASQITGPFVHLHGHSQYSVLQSTASINGIVKKAKELNMPAVAITDLGNMFGTFKFVKAALKSGIQPIVGCEFYLAKNHTDKTVKDHFIQEIFIAKNLNGYHNLAKLSSISHIDGFYYVPRIDKELIKKYAEDIIVISGNRFGSVGNAILNVGEQMAEEEIIWWKDVFGDDYYLELCDHGLPEEKVVNKAIIELSEKYNVKTVATNNYFYLNQEDSEAHDVLLCVKDGERQSTPIGKGRGFRYGFPNDQFYFRSQEEMKQLFANYPLSIENISEVLTKIEPFKLERDVFLPKFEFPTEFKTEDEFLKHITYEGAKKRYPEITDEIKERLDFELKVIENTGYPGYFLIVQDFTTKAREMGVSVGPGRGSAAGSVVAYCIGITNVDPIKYDLLFERFLNPDRVSLPDIDIDFDDVGRSKIIDYVLEKYGKTQVAQIITYGSMAAKSSIRDAGRVLELPLPDTDRLAKLIPETPGTTLQKAFKAVKELSDIKTQDNEEGRILRQAEIIEGSLRSTGVHACGVIITPTDITELIPVTTAKDSDLLLTQYDNSVVESAGLLKMDFLGLKTLTIIKDAIEIVKARKGIEINPDNIPLDDPKTYELYQNGETNGTFQFESAGMQKYLKQLKPDAFEDLIAMNALYRPGPLEYIPNFIARKHGKEPITYDLPEMEEYLKETYGITVYQEQVMRLSQKLANFSKGDADLLRKAMGKKIKALLDELKPKFIGGCKDNGHDEKIAEKIWKDWEAFAAYAFNKSHSTCYSVVAFQTAYLKANHPAEYMAAVLTNNMNDIKKVTFFMDECKRMNQPVLGPDLNESYYKFAVNKNNEIRFGLAAIKGVGGAAVQSILKDRKEKGPYASIFDLVRRADLRVANKKTFESLALSGAFDSLNGVHRAQLFHEIPGESGIFLEKALKYGSKYQSELNSAQVSLFGESSEVSMPEPSLPECEEWGRLEALSKEKEVVGVYISGHPLDDYKVELKYFCNTTLAELEELEHQVDKEVSFAGIVTEASHRVSKTGKPFGSFTVEDYNSSMQIFLFSQDYVNFKNFLNQGWFLFLKGRVKQKAYRDGQFEVKLNSLELLQNIREKLTKSISIKVTTEELNEASIEKLHKLCIENKGKSKLKIRIEDPSTEIKVDTFSRTTMINMTNEFLTELDHLNFPYKVN